MGDIEALERECVPLNECLDTSRNENKLLELTEDAFKCSDTKVTHYTGMANFTILSAVFSVIEGLASHSANNCLLKFQEFLLFMMKLKLNLRISDLAFRFSVSDATVSRIFDKWLNAATCQIIGVFSTKGNIKGDLLFKIIIEAVILSEKAGLFVDHISCDGATWNRKMWPSANKVVCKTEHPVGSKGALYFVSDFPHFIKCFRNGLLKTGFTTPDGHASQMFWALEITTMPCITRMFPFLFTIYRCRFRVCGKHFYVIATCGHSR